MASSLTDRIRVEIDVTEPPGVRGYGMGSYGFANYGTGDTTTDIARYVTSASIDRGRTEGLQRPDVGRCTVSVVRWHPRYTGYENLLGRPFRLMGKRVDNTWQPIFTGRVEDASMIQTGTGTGEPYDTWTITAVDALGFLQIVTPSAEYDWINYKPPQESAADRVNGLCAIFTNFSTENRSTYSGTGTLVQGNLTISGSLLDHFGLVGDSTGQIVYASTDGVVVLDEEDPDAGGALVNTDYSNGRTMLAVTDGVWTPSVAEPPYKVLGSPETAVVRFAAGSIRNFTVDQNLGGTRNEYESAGSVATLGRRPYVRTDLIGTGTSVFSPSTIGNNWLSRYQFPRGRLAEVRVHLPSTESTVDPIDLATELDVVARLQCRLPADETGHQWHTNGRTLGHRWDLLPDVATLTLFAESICTEV